MTVSVQEKKLDPVKNRDIKYLETDISAVRAIAQAAINVELFTIPLYMVALYSIQGTHQINSKGIDYYKGRLWPGSATTATPDTANKKAFNIVFSVFVQEMLHVQMAANLAKAIGVDPSFTSSLLQDDKHGWTCYGKNKTVIPHIIDFKDTYESIEVKLDALNKKQIYLLLAIEQNENQARKKIKPEAIDKYFPTVPFANWAPNKTEKDLPRFGTIGWLYECYACYLSIEYKDGKTLWDHVYKPNVLLQRDMFNYTNTGHPAKEFPEFEPKIKDTSVAFNEAIDMMSAITDQGEGSTIKDEHGWQEGPGWQELVQELQRCFAGNQWAKNELSRLKNELPTEDILENPTIEDSYLMINLLLYQVREYLRKNPVRKNPDLLANLDRDENKIITDLLDNSNQNFTYDDWKCIIKINQRLEKEPDFNDKGEGRADGRDNVVMELKNSCQLEPYYRIILEKVMGSIDYFNGDENTLFSNNNNLRKLVEIGKFLYDNYMQEVLPVDPVLSLTRWKKNLSQNTEDEKVEDKYRPSKEALEEDYPAYTDTGGSATSRDAIARYPNSEKSHYDRFKEVQTLLYDPEFITWDTWHNRGNIWTAEMLKTDDYKPKKKIPTPKEVAGALNRLKNDPNGKKIVSQAAVGAIAGITTVLNDYWEKEKTNFPYPSMVGSGDRVSICWAIFGEVPDLSLSLVSLDSENKVSPDIENKVPKLFHACQGLNLKDPTDKREAPVEVFHSCRGSNKCKAQGGCGFAQLDTGGGSCRSVTLREGGVLPGESGNDYSSPADNRCKGFGGCAVPISASQLFPKSGTMTLYKFDNDNNPQKLPEKITFEKGDNVYAKAWEAYCKVRKVNENPPEASDLRVAFPPST